MMSKKLTIALTAFALVAADVLVLSQSAHSRALRDRSEIVDGALLNKPADEVPWVSIAAHNVGKIVMTVTNKGQIGTGFVGAGSCDGESCPSTEYPKNSTVSYLFAGAFWVGAIVGRDTLVSVGADGWLGGQEFHPSSRTQRGIIQDDGLEDSMQIWSISDPNDPNFYRAKSEQDITCAYADTLTDGVPGDSRANRPHIPLNIKVRETSYAWSYEYAEDFVLFDYKIKNIGNRTLDKVYFGIYVDGDVGHSDNPQYFTDDICGFLRSWELRDTVYDANGNPIDSCPTTYDINIAYLGDNDGINAAAGPLGSETWEKEDPRAVVGSSVIRTPSDSLEFSFNWWISNGNAQLDFGPRLVPNEDDPWRDFGGFLGTPDGDHNKYYILSHEEFDYDQLFSAVANTQVTDGRPFRQPSPSLGPDFANGFDTRYLLSFGPFTVFPGEVLPLTFAYVAGEDWHDGRLDFETYFDAFQPDLYYSRLNFKDLATNARWASWIYDNPCVDSDSDGFEGIKDICYSDLSARDTNYDTTIDTFVVPPDTMIDTIIFNPTGVDTTCRGGDGVPDFRGAAPPPAPRFKIYPSTGSFNIRWTGVLSEGTVDPFSKRLDFEGYRVYLSIDDNVSDFVLQGSYDKENYTRHFYKDDVFPWPIAGVPQTKAQIQDIYAGGNRDYDPLDNGPDNPLTLTFFSPATGSVDSVFYFVKQDFNVDDLSDTTQIFKPYPNEPVPHTRSIDSAFAWGVDTFWIDSLGDTTFYPNGELTEDGEFLRYFTYQFNVHNLLPSQRYFVAVTAFDFGAPESGLDALESNILTNSKAEFALEGPSDVNAGGPGVIVYPNPYRSDAGYRETGFEGRGRGAQNEERDRRVHFTNLPEEYSIRIFTLDGDLVREVTYPREDRLLLDDCTGESGGHDCWNLVTRNGQNAVSGIYYWTVEDTKTGHVQTGKLVLIM